MAFLFKNHMEEALRVRAEAAELEVAAANMTIRELEDLFAELEKAKKSATEDAAAVAARELKRHLDAQAQKHAAEIEALKAAHADELRKQADEFKVNLDQAYQQFSDENARLQANLQSTFSALREESSQVVAGDSQSIASGSSASAQLLKPGVIAAKGIFSNFFHGIRGAIHEGSAPSKKRRIDGEPTENSN